MSFDQLPYYLTMFVIGFGAMPAALRLVCLARCHHKWGVPLSMWGDDTGLTRWKEQRCHTCSAVRRLPDEL